MITTATPHDRFLMRDQRRAASDEVTSARAFGDMPRARRLARLQSVVPIGFSYSASAQKGLGEVCRNLEHLFPRDEGQLALSQ
jgi:hypothetical protein